MEAAPHVVSVFLLLGGSITAGYVGHWIFQRHRVSDILFLLLVGVLAGPVLGLADAAFFRPAALVLAPLALTIVLFEAGLDIELDALRRAWRPALLLTAFAWTATAGALALSTHWLFDFTWPVAALFGIAVSATGILGVVPLLQRLRAPTDTRVMLTLETSVGDLLSAVATTALASALVLQTSAATSVGILAAKLGIGAAVGFLIGIAWARTLHALNGDRHGFALTLGAIVVGYAATETLHGSGYLMALTFGIVVGNAGALMRLGGLRALAPPTDHARLHQSEAIFLLRSVFFVFLGLSVPREMLSLPMLGAGALLTIVLIVSRAGAVLAACRLARVPTSDGRGLLLVSMMPRGLAAAVIAGIPAAMGVPGTDGFLGLTFLIIVGADLAATGGIYLYERGRPRHAHPHAGVGAPDASVAARP